VNGAEAVSALAIEDVQAKLGALAGRIETDVGAALGQGEATLAQHWTGFAWLRAGSALREHAGAVGMVAQVVAAVGAALGPLIAAAVAAEADRAAAQRAAAGLGLEVDGFEVRVRPDAPDPTLAAAGARGVRDLLAAAVDVVRRADRECAQELDSLSALAPRTRVGLGPAPPVPPHLPPTYDPLAPTRDSDGLVALAVGLLGVTLRRAAQSGWSLFGHGVGTLATALRDPVAAAGELALPPLAREVTAAVALAEEASTATPGSSTAGSLTRLLTRLTSAEPGGLPVRLLQFDRDAGEIAEVVGDLTSADQVVLFVPGTGSGLGKWGSTERAIDAIAAAVRVQPGSDRIAVIGWHGSDSPPDLVHAALQSYAKEAAPRLAEFIAGLQLRPGVRLTLVGHSYGGVVAGTAIRAGARPDALVGVAAPGFGPKVDSVTDLADTPTYVLTHPGDPIGDVQPLQSAVITALAVPLGGLGLLGARTLVDRVTGAAGLGHLGDDPTCVTGAKRLSTGDDHADPPLLRTDVDLHSDYFDPGSTALRQIALVALDRPATPYTGPGCGS